MTTLIERGRVTEAPSAAGREALLFEQLGQSSAVIRDTELEVLLPDGTSDGDIEPLDDL